MQTYTITTMNRSDDSCRINTNTQTARKQGHVDGAVAHLKADGFAHEHTGPLTDGSVVHLFTATPETNPIYGEDHPGFVIVVTPE